MSKHLRSLIARIGTQRLSKLHRIKQRKDWLRQLMMVETHSSEVNHSYDSGAEHTNHSLH